MFASTSPLPAPPSPSLQSRLRGLSYLRNFNHSHLSPLSNNGPSPTSTTTSFLSRSTSTPSSEIPSSASTDSSPPLAPPILLGHGAGYLASLTGPAASSPTSIPPSPSVSHRSKASGYFNEHDVRREMARRKKSESSTQAPVPPPPPPPPQQQQQQQENRRPHLHGSTNGEAGSYSRSPANSPESSGLAGLPFDQMPTIRLLPHHDVRSNKPSLAFAATSRTLPHEDCLIRVGRYSERDINQNPPANVPSSAPVGFKSKVVSRRHCEFWCSQGQWYIKDVKSSSGTFLNHIRLSQPSVESRPFPVNDGDVVQLGIDFRGGEEQIFRCVKIRIECNRAWQKTLNSYNMSTHKRLRALGAAKKDGDTSSTHSTECSICLMSIAPCQSLFVAPCSHVWHFKCIRPILTDTKSYPQFLCPNCRAVTDLEADVDDPLDDWDETAEDAVSDHVSDPDPDSGNNVPETTLLPPTSPGQTGTSQPAALDEAVTGINRDPSLHSPREHPTRCTRNDGSQPLDPSSEPVAIPPRSIDMSPNGGLRPITPGSGAGVHAGHVGETHEGPLTPRNDAGPFVFDGSAGRAAGRTLMGATGGMNSN